MEPDGNELVIEASEGRSDITTRELYDDLNFLFKSNKFTTISIKISGLRKEGYVVRDNPISDQNLHYWRLTEKGLEKVLEPYNGILKKFMMKMIEIHSDEKSNKDKSSSDDDLEIITNRIETQKVKSNSKHLKNEKDKLRELFHNKHKYGGL